MTKSITILTYNITNDRREALWGIAGAPVGGGGRGRYRYDVSRKRLLNNRELWWSYVMYCI